MNGSIKSKQRLFVSAVHFSRPLLFLGLRFLVFLTRKENILVYCLSSSYIHRQFLNPIRLASTQPLRPPRPPGDPIARRRPFRPSERLLPGLPIGVLLSQLPRCTVVHYLLKLNLSCQRLARTACAIVLLNSICQAAQLFAAGSPSSPSIHRLPCTPESPSTPLLFVHPPLASHRASQLLSTPSAFFFPSFFLPRFLSYPPPFDHFIHCFHTPSTFLFLSIYFFFFFFFTDLPRPFQRCYSHTRTSRFFPDSLSRASRGYPVASWRTEEVRYRGEKIARALPPYLGDSHWSRDPRTHPLLSPE